MIRRFPEPHTDRNRTHPGLTWDVDVKLPDVKSVGILRGGRPSPDAGSS
jgi:hypothetical protein